MKHLLCLFLIFGWITPQAQSSHGVADPVTTAFERWVDDDIAGAAQLLSDHVGAGAARLSALEGEEADRLADDLEVALVLLERITNELENPSLVRRLIGGIEVDRAFGMLSARLSWLRGDRAGDLGTLMNWSFVGPFDNERGRGMTRATPAEASPVDSSYEGKVRKVEWRVTPEPLPASGVLHFGALMDPNDQSCVVARTWINSEVGRDVLLLVGMTEELRVWAQGKALYEALDGYRFGFDGHVIPVRLDPGWTEVVVKVGCGADAQPTLCARIVEPVRGRVVKLRQVATAPEGLGPRQLESPERGFARPAVVLRPGAWRRHAEGDTPEDRFRLALLQQAAQNVPASERPGRVAAEASVTARPGVLRYELVRLSTLREQGALATEEDTNPWREALDRMLAAHGDQARLLRQRAGHVAAAQGLLSVAMDYNSRALLANPESIPARWQRIRFLSSMGQQEQAAWTARQLAADPAVRDWVSIGMELGSFLARGSDSRNALIAIGAEAGRVSALLEQSHQERLQADDRGPEGIRRVLESIVRRRPWSTQVRSTLARTAIAMDETDLAIELIEDALRLAPQRPALYRQYFSALTSQGRKAEALAALEHSVELDFGNEDNRRLLEVLRASGAEAFFAPWEESLQAVLDRREHDEPIASGTAGREVLLDRRVVEVQPDGGSKLYRRTVQRVLSEAGASQLDRRTWRAFPGQDEVRVLAARVLHADGRSDEAPTGRSGRRGVVSVDLPPLVPGDVVDIAWRRDERPSEVFGSYFGLDVGLINEPSLPLRESELVLVWPESLPLYLHTRGWDASAEPEARMEPAGEGRRMARWSLHDQAPQRLEPWMPPSQELGPRVQASTYRDWSEFGNWWWNLIEDEIRVSPEMRDKVAALTSEAQTPLERLRSVYDFVVTDIRYNAWEFGIHGYEPYSAPVIFSRGFGDCKDKAILLRSLLSVVGIEAQPVLIRSEPRRFEEDLQLPLVSHFNHCIAWVPEQEGIPAMYLDGTARLHPMEVLPDSDAGAKVVVVDAAGVKVARVPFPTYGANLERRSIHIDLDSDGASRVRVTFTPEGRFDPRDRYRFTGSEDERDEEAERLLSGLFGSLRGELSSQWPDFEDLTEAPVTVLESEVESVSRPTAKGFDVDTCFDPLHLLRGLASETTRSTDLLLDVPWTRETVLDLEWGGDGEVLHLPEAVRLDSPEVGFQRTVTRTEAGVRIVDRFELKTHRIPAERYAAFRELARAVDQAQSESIEVEVKP